MDWLAPLRGKLDGMGKDCACESLECRGDVGQSLPVAIARDQSQSGIA